MAPQPLACFISCTLVSPSCLSMFFSLLFFFFNTESCHITLVSLELLALLHHALHARVAGQSQVHLLPSL